MPKEIVLGNGNLSVCMDEHGYIRDLYYPYVGQENHVRGHRNRVGIWTEGRISWLEEPSWKIEIDYKKDTLVSDIHALNKEMAVELILNDCVHHDENIFIRKVIIKNLDEREREIRLFFNQHFDISEANIGNTAYYQPFEKAIICYKGMRYFLFNSSCCESVGVRDYAVGVSGLGNMQGTWVDAEDGILSQNPIEHGSVDSTICLKQVIGAHKESECYYWIAAGKKFKEVVKLNRFIKDKKPEALLNDTHDYWKKWIKRCELDLSPLKPHLLDLFKRSLLILMAQTDKRGAIIASIDSDMLQFKLDTYAYMWPRDGALISRSLDRSGYKEITKNFFEFCGNVLTDYGYFLHKYRPDRSLGSSWHPWIVRNRPHIPVQEDQIALVVDAIWKHCEHFRDEEWEKGIYLNIVKKAADFMSSFINRKTNLPEFCYDLWEEKLGIHTFTCCTVYAGLKAASKLAKRFGDSANAKKYDAIAERIRKAIKKEMYEDGIFVKGIYLDEEGNWMKDRTIDMSSVYGIFEFGIIDIDDKRVETAMKNAIDALRCNTKIGGFARYEGDNYHRKSDVSAGNPWVVPTMWVAEYYIQKAKKKEDLGIVEELFEWVYKRISAAGILAEQYDPLSGVELSVAPLSWSHAAFIIAATKYLEKIQKL